MSDLSNLFIIILLLTVSLAAYFVTIQVLFAGRVAKTKGMLQGMPARSFGIGLVNFSFFFVIALVLFSISDRMGNGFLKAMLMIPGLALLAFLAMLLTFGLAGVISYMGENILPAAGPWKQMLWGTVCLSLACALPFVGWFVLLPCVGFAGIGAFILSVFQREPKASFKSD
jgi:hypothetical protein